MMKNRAYKDMVDWYRSRFALFENNLNGESKSDIHRVRRTALEKFSELGFPTPKNEEWKYTNVESLARTEFNFKSAEQLAVTSVEDYKFGMHNAHLLVFVDGQFSNMLSETGSLPEGVKVLSLAEGIEKNPQEIYTFLSRHAAFEQDGFTALSTAFMQDGAYVHISKNVDVEQPVHLLFLTTDSSEKRIIQPRNLIVAEKNARVTLVESWHSLGENNYFNNVVTEVVVEDNARVDHVKLQNENIHAYHIASTFVKQSRDSQFHNTSISFGGSLTRNNITAMLDAEHISTTLNGVYIADGQQHMDTHTTIHHAKPHCESSEMYKGILDGKARGVFNGKIHVHEDAQKTNAMQGNHTILLSDNATIDTKPQLEIYADDVRCTHGATVGQMDDDAFFYMRARGLDPMQARQLLLFAFASEVIDSIQPKSLREHIAGLMSAKMHTVDPL